MNISRKFGSSALALTIALGTALAVTPSFASKDRVEHQDRQDRTDHSKSTDRVSHDKSGDKNDNGGDRGDR